MTTPPRVDGRHERTRRTRKAILTAVLDLIDEGHLEPTAAQIAERASIAVRSIRQHFASREALFLAASEAHAARVAPPTEGVDPSLPLAERVAAFTEVRARELEATARVRRAATLAVSAPDAAPTNGEPATPSRGSAIVRATGTTWKRRRDEVAAVFANELADGPGPLLDALDLATHGRTWDTMREALGLSRSAATALVRMNLSALLAGSGGAPGRTRRSPEGRAR